MESLRPEDLAAVLLSLKVAAAATIASAPVALLTALAQARGRYGVRVALDALVTLPLVLPPVATGYVLLLLFGRRGPLGALLEKAGIVFAFDWTGAALAAAIMAFPLMVRPMRLAIEAIDREVVEAALTLGAPPLMRFIRVTLPLAAPGVAAGAILGFAKALGEFGATITFVAAIPGETLTLPSAIYAAVQSPGGEARAAALCLVAATLAVAAVLVSDAVGRLAVRAARGRAD
ncbi:MAG: molybdate ABC transporter permease subunit [Phenylobacterium sp.]|uniref:molybdate ABC transporter permease subunit n=1 Tax=Phenylobacterium sp. TaxID=1871053 RepID=UPI0039197496